MHILQIIIKENFYGDKLDFKDIKFLVKVRDFRKIERKNSIDISLFGYEDGDLLLIGRGEKNTMFLSNISIHSCMITNYIVGENIFDAIVYKFLEQQMYWNVILKIALKLIVSRGWRCPKKWIR